MTIRSIIILVLFSGFLFFIPKALLAKPVGSLREITEMSFGTITVDSSGDTITLSPSGGITTQGTSIVSGTYAAAEFTVSGDKNTAFSISFSSGDSLTGPGTSMSLGSFTHSAGTSPVFDNKGKALFTVGASLTINSPQIDGSYSGTYTIFVDYT